MAFVFGPRRKTQDGKESDHLKETREWRLHFASRLLKKDSFSLGATLGSGSFGRVKIAAYVDPSDPTRKKRKYFALKILKKIQVLKASQITHTLDEKGVLAKIRHPFIVNLYAAFQDKQNLYMLMEFVIGGELFSALQKYNKFPAAIARFYASEVVLAFEYLHTLQIVYRDLKPENLLLDHEGHIKITDFGFAKVVPDRTYTLCGTPEYLAPEIIHNRGHGIGVDWWSLGILIYEMLAGYPPFYDDNPVNVYKKITAMSYTFRSHFDPSARDMITKLLNPDITSRLGCMKGGASDIKSHKWFKGVDWTATLNRKVSAPEKPKVKGPNDTSCFEDYPDSVEMKGHLTRDEADLFKDF